MAGTTIHLQGLLTTTVDLSGEGPAAPEPENVWLWDDGETMLWEDGADTFQLSDSEGGLPLALSGSQSGTHTLRWTGAGRSIYSRNIYIGDDTEEASPLHLEGTISLRSASEHAQLRAGGDIIDNLFARGSAGYLLNKRGTAHGNVTIESDDITPDENFTVDYYRGQGILVDNAGYLTGGVGITVYDEVIAHNRSSASVTGGNSYAVSVDQTYGHAAPYATIDNIIIYDWWRAEQNNDAGNVTITNLHTDLTGANTEGYPNPERLLGDYAAFIGVGTTFEDYADYLVNRPLRVFNDTYWAAGPRTYIRQGFGLVESNYHTVRLTISAA